MPRTIAQIKCRECDDVFTATTEEYTSCKCGKNKVKVKVDQFSTQYKNTDGMGMYFDRLSSNTYYLESDFYIMQDDVLDLFNEVKVLCEELEFDIRDYYEYGENKEKYLRTIEFIYGQLIKSSSMEYNYIRFNVNYRNIDEDTLIERLIEFKQVLILLKNKEIDLSNREKMMEDYDDYDEVDLGYSDCKFNF